MEKSPHVMMVGDGAEAFAKEQGMTFVPESYFYTERRWQELQRTLEAEKKKGRPVGRALAGRARACVLRHGRCRCARQEGRPRCGDVDRWHDEQAIRPRRRCADHRRRNVRQ
jgi:hypothetical protein